MVEVIIVVFVGDEGKLFGFVGICDIVDVIIVVGVEVEKVEVKLFIGIFCEIGEYDIDL